MVVQMDRMGWPEFDAILKPSRKEPKAMRDLARELALLLQKKISSSSEKKGVYLVIAATIDEETLRQKEAIFQGSKIYGMGIFRKF